MSTYFFIDKPSNVEETEPDISQVEKKLENIQLTRNPSEHLDMESVLGNIYILLISTIIV